MFGEPGIDVNDIGWIERDQFVYFMEMERHLANPGDWPRFRLGLVDALAAAFGWEPSASDQASLETLELLDRVRELTDPKAEWDRFLEAVWSEVSARRERTSPR